VLVLHEAGGLLDFARDVCDRLAREGFVALAPDLYGGRTGADPEAAARLMMDLDAARAGSILDAAVAAGGWRCSPPPAIGGSARR
jgi:carboxymethylenebutenolidase